MGAVAAVRPRSAWALMAEHSLEQAMTPELPVASALDACGLGLLGRGGGEDGGCRQSANLARMLPPPVTIPRPRRPESLLSLQVRDSALGLARTRTPGVGPLPVRHRNTLVAVAQAP